MKARIVLFAIAGAMIVIQIFSPAIYTVESLRLSASVAVFDLGYTEIRLPPLGAISAQTHISPVKLTVGLDSIDIDLLQNLTGPDSDRAVADMIGGLRSAATTFIVRHSLLAIAGGSLGALLVGPRTIENAAGGGLIGVGAATVLATATYFTFDADAFLQPRYEGVLKAAPWIVTVWQDAMARAGDLSDTLALIGENLHRVFGQIDELAQLGQPQHDVAVLIVSDIHNNALVVDFIATVAETFDVDLIIDAGDLTDFGSEIEAGLISGLAGIDIPYVLVPGNHEAPAALAKLAQQGVVIADGSVQQIAGVNVIGFTDPSADRQTAIVIPGELAPHRDYAEQYLDRLPQLPDIVAAHNPIIARAGIGRVPVVIEGHNHRLYVEQQEDTVIINPGTTGGAGIRGLSARQEIPFSVAVLYLGRNEDGCLTPVAVDSIKVFNLKTQFIIERLLIRGEEQPSREQENDEAGKP